MTARYLSTFGRPTFLLGVNYWSRGGGPRMWARFDEARVREEVRQMRRCGMNACRSFLYLPTFMPAPPAVEPEALARLATFLRLCGEEGLATAPSLLVGHMSGENYDFPGQRGRSPYTDEEVRGWAHALARAAAGAAAGAPALYAWILSNEMPLWGGAAEPATIAAWMDGLIDALRAVDPVTPIGTGDGHMNAKGGQNGFDAEAIARACDYLGPHAYYGDLDPMRAALNAEFVVRSLQHLGRPVVFEEFGGSSAQVSEANQAAFYRETILGVLAVGGAGALGWCYSDFDLEDEGPYDHHAFELGFGVTRADGSEKPVCDEYRAIARLLDGLDLGRLRFPEPQAAIVVPTYLHVTYPFSWEDRARMRRDLLQAYVLAAKAGVECAVVPETADLARYRLLLVPSTQKLRQPTWRALRRAAEAGATVYWSYHGGDHAFHQGAWIHDFEALVGARHGLRYGCFDLPPAEATLRGELGELTTGTQGGSPYGRSYLPIEPTRATTVGWDGLRRPALLRHDVGRGAVYFLNHPWEHYLGERAEVNETDGSHQLYGWLAERAGLERAPRPADPRAQVHVARDGDATLLFLFNRSWAELAPGLELPRRGTTQLLGGAGDTLAPKEVRVYRLLP